MGFFDALFGRNKPPKAQIDPLFALSTAIISFAELGWESPASIFKQLLRN